MLIQHYSVTTARVSPAKCNCLPNLNFQVRFSYPERREVWSLGRIPKSQWQHLGSWGWVILNSFFFWSQYPNVKPLCLLLVSPETKPLASCWVRSVYQAMPNKNWERRSERSNCSLDRISTNSPTFISTSRYYLWISLVLLTAEYFGDLMMQMAHFLLVFPLWVHSTCSYIFSSSICQNLVNIHLVSVPYQCIYSFMVIL